jgi:hypothetical protein
MNKALTLHHKFVFVRMFHACVCVHVLASTTFETLSKSLKQQIKFQSTCKAASASNKKYYQYCINLCREEDDEPLQENMNSCLKIQASNLSKIINKSIARLQYAAAATQQGREGHEVPEGRGQTSCSCCCGEKKKRSDAGQMPPVRRESNTWPEDVRNASTASTNTTTSHSPDGISIHEATRDLDG